MLGKMLYIWTLFEPQQPQDEDVLCNTAAHDSFKVMMTTSFEQDIIASEALLRNIGGGDRLYKF